MSTLPTLNSRSGESFLSAVFQRVLDLRLMSAEQIDAFSAAAHAAAERLAERHTAFRSPRPEEFHGAVILIKQHLTLALEHRSGGDLGVAANTLATHPLPELLREGRQHLASLRASLMTEIARLEHEEGRLSADAASVAVILESWTTRSLFQIGQRYGNEAQADRALTQLRFFRRELEMGQFLTAAVPELKTELRAASYGQLIENLIANLHLDRRPSLSITLADVRAFCRDLVPNGELNQSLADDLTAFGLEPLRQLGASEALLTWFRRDGWPQYCRDITSLASRPITRYRCLMNLTFYPRPSRGQRTVSIVSTAAREDVYTDILRSSADRQTAMFATLDPYDQWELLDRLGQQKQSDLAARLVLSLPDRAVAKILRLAQVHLRDVKQPDPSLSGWVVLTLQRLAHDPARQANLTNVMRTTRAPNPVPPPP